MSSEGFIDLVIQSLRKIKKAYRKPYKDHLYERILCYEFYHQFRMHMNDENFPFVLHGELYKGYRDIKRAPDFIFHIPDTDRNNFAVIEFKSTKNDIKEIIEDLEKLKEFRTSSLKYQIGILVVFGEKDKLCSTKRQLCDIKISGNVELKILFFDIVKGNVSWQCNLYY